MCIDHPRTLHLNRENISGVAAEQCGLLSKNQVTAMVSKIKNWGFSLKCLSNTARRALELR